MKWKKWLENWDMTSLKIKTPFLEMDWNPQEKDKDAQLQEAYTICQLGIALSEKMKCSLTPEFYNALGLLKTNPFPFKPPENSNTVPAK